MHKPKKPVIYWSQPQQPPYRPLRSSLYWAHVGFFGHFDIRIVWKWNQNNLRTFWNVASDDLKTTSKRPQRSNPKNQCIFDLKRKLWPCNEMEYIIQAVKISFQLERVFVHWIIKNIASFRCEAVEAVQWRQPQNWLSMHKSPLLRIPKMGGFCLECNFVLKKCWFEVGQSMFKHPVVEPNFNSCW